MTYLPNNSGTVLTNNSSSTPLGGAGVFTGAWQDVSGYDSVVVAVKADVDGSYQIQFSPDGTNADSTLTRYYRTAQIEAPHRFTVTRQYMRVVYTNGASAQSTFRLQTSVGLKNPLNAPIDGILPQDFDATVVRPTSPTHEVALGRRQGWETWNKFGYNEDIDTTTDPEIIAAWGGTFTYITSGETIDIVSSSANDDASPATGAQQIIIWGVDEDWLPQTEIVEMNGVTPVTTTSQWIGINRVSIYLAGSGMKNDGNITITATTSGDTLAYMPAGEGTSQQAIFYVAADHKFLASFLWFNAIKTGGGANPEIQYVGWVYSAVANAEFEVFRGSIDVADETTLSLTPPEPFVIGEKSILWFTAETDQNDTSVRARFSGQLVRDVDA